MNHRFLVVCSAIGAAIGASWAFSDEVVLAPTRDNTLYQSTVGNLSNGAGDHFFAGTSEQFDQAIRRGLVHFDVAGSIPAGATITSVTLRLNCSRTRAGTEPISLHRVLADWGEGASDADGEEGAGTGAEPGDATWLHTFYDTDEWTNEGGDFDDQSSASRTVGGSGPYLWGSTTGMVADVQSWLDDPDANFGWIVIGDESDEGTSKRFDTRDHPTESVRPRLTIEFTPPPIVVLPSAFTRVRGLPVSGGLPDLFADDDSRLVSRPDVFRTTATAPVQIRVVGTSPDATPGEIRFIVESHAGVNNIMQRVLLFNYDTQVYDQVDARVMPLTDGVIEVRVTSNPERYVNDADGEMATLLQYNAIAFSIAPTWQARQDRTTWTIVP